MPGYENNTKAYAEAVAKRLVVLTIDPVKIKNPATLRGMILSIIIHENGANPYPAAIIEEGMRRALPPEQRVCGLLASHWWAFQDMAVERSEAKAA